MGRIKLEELSLEMQANALLTVKQANALLSEFGEVRVCNSGYRSAKDQAVINPKAPKSKHMTCQAIDISDRDGKLKHFCLNNLHVLEALNLWMEDAKSTPTWVHVQIVPPKSKRRIFIP